VKECGRCKATKDEGEFYIRRRPDGRTDLHTYCKQCLRRYKSENVRVKSAARRRKRQAAKAAAMEQPTKVCPDCCQTLPKEAFYRQADMWDGLRRACKDCYNLRERIGKFLRRKATARTNGVKPRS
jgi:DNA repair exonuclease SbcCD ATPase subunit